LGSVGAGAELGLVEGADARLGDLLLLLGGYVAHLIKRGVKGEGSG